MSICSGAVVRVSVYVCQLLVETSCACAVFTFRLTRWNKNSSVMRAESLVF